MLKPFRNESFLELNIRAHYIAMEPTPVMEPIPAGEPTPEAEPNLAVEPALKIDPNPVVPILVHMTATKKMVTHRLSIKMVWSNRKMASGIF